MQRITLLAKHITADFAQYRFLQGDTFRWSPSEQTVHHRQIVDLEDAWSLLHEIAHGELGHYTYALDVQLVQQEVQAWEHAATSLAPTYGLAITDDYLQDHLDTYRVWLHNRSQCPDCGQNGLQTKNTYSCINCRCTWRANEARLCALRRIRLPSQDQIS